MPKHGDVIVRTWFGHGYSLLKFTNTNLKSFGENLCLFGLVTSISGIFTHRFDGVLNLEGVRRDHIYHVFGLSFGPKVVIRGVLR